VVVENVLVVIHSSVKCRNEFPNIHVIIIVPWAVLLIQIIYIVLKSCFVLLTLPRAGRIKHLVSFQVIQILDNVYSNNYSPLLPVGIPHVWM
jgi:hypothetical protein